MRIVPPSLRLRTFVAATAVASTLFTGVTARAQYSYSYPPCEDPQSSQCAMQDLNPGSYSSRVLNGAVPLYILWYGPFTSNGAIALQDILPTFIASLNDSSYMATSTTYSGPAGSAAGQIYLAGEQSDPGMYYGTSMVDSQVQWELSSYISLGSANGGFDYNANAIYLLIPGQGVTITDGNNPPNTVCQNECGYNNLGLGIDSANQEVAFSYLVVADSFDGKCCNWGVQTPNNAGGLDTNGYIDGELSGIAHEINEAITNPSGEAGGWDTPANGPINLQIADYCQPALGAGAFTTDWTTALGSDYYYVTIPGGSLAYANVHGLYGTDFLLQTLRVNANGGAHGYCVNEYGGVFWGKNFGYSQTPYTQNNGDWAPGSYKGECHSGQALTGISKYTSGAAAHAVMCSSVWDSANFMENSSCTPLYFDHGYGTVGNVQWYVDPPPVGDWDYGYYKAECGSNMFVGGVSQSTSGIVNGILCCTPSPGSVTHKNCHGELVNSTLNAIPYPSYDWDNGYYKATCPATPAYVAGVSADTHSGQVHSILCCDP